MKEAHRYWTNALAMTTDKSYDLLILGGGPGGYVAAIRAAQLGLNVGLIDKDKALGGTCLHRGCIPTKALLHYTEMVEKLANCADYGIDLGSEPTIDFSRMHASKNKVVKRMAGGISSLMKANGITVINGYGRLVGEKQIEVDGTIYKADNVVLATGSRPASLPFLKADGKRVFTSDELLSSDTVPESMVVLGAGAVGLEFACVYSALGTKVEVVEMADRPLPIEDEDISKEVLRVYKKRGIPIHCSVRLESADISDTGVKLSGQNLKKDEPVSYTTEVVLCAVGRRPVLDDIGLEQFNLTLERGFLKVDERCRTDLDWLYAIGDIVVGPQLAHVASAEGIVCVEGIAGHPTHPIDYERIPSATYCRPEVASIGLTEAQAKAKGYQVATGRFPWAALGKASIIGQSDGFVKIVADEKYGELLGVHIVGAHATDLIAEACIALSCEATVEELFRTVHAHPTLPEGLMEAAHGVFSQPIHLPPVRSKRRSK